jgi:allantoin racemase
LRRIDMKIRIITPIVRVGRPRPRSRDYEERMRKLAGLCQDTTLDRVRIEKGPASIESRYDEVLASPSITAKVKEAEADGVDAAVVNCFGDPGVRASRELVSIPVVGPCESSMHVAASLCDRFSVVTILKNVVPLIEENALIYGVSRKLVSTRAIDIPVLELHSDSEATVEALCKIGRKAIEEDGAETLVLGCTGMTGLAERIKEELGVFVVDPLPTALKFAETLVALELSHSKIAYPPPPEKQRIG